MSNEVKSPPAIAVAVMSNSVPVPAEAAEAAAVSDFIVITFMFVLATKVSELLSMVIDWNLLVGAGVTPLIPENTAVVLAPAVIVVLNPVPV